MLHAPCSMLHAPCSMLHAPCSMLHVPSNECGKFPNLCYYTRLMYYFMCPSCSNKNDIDRDVTGQQFACGHCGHVQYVETCYFDPPTDSVPTASAIAQQQQQQVEQQTVQQPVNPQIPDNQPAVTMPKPRPAKTMSQASSPKKKKKKGTMQTTKTISPQKKRSGEKYKVQDAGHA